MDNATSDSNWAAHNLLPFKTWFLRNSWLKTFQLDGIEEERVNYKVNEVRWRICLHIALFRKFIVVRKRYAKP